MAAILNFGGACSNYLKIIKTMGDKLKLITDIRRQTHIPIYKHLLVESLQLIFDIVSLMADTSDTFRLDGLQFVDELAIFMMLFLQL